MAEKRERFYRGSIFVTLEDLKQRCRGDESDLAFALINLELGNQNNNDGTIGTYEETADPNNTDFGNLIFESYKNEGEANVLETQHELQGATKMFRGKARIGDKNLKVTVLRGS